MSNEIISYLDVCLREGGNLQKGMNFRLRRTYSVILMSVRPNAPYRDRIEDDGSTLIYEGHDVPARKALLIPRHLINQKLLVQAYSPRTGSFILLLRNLS